jgi:hypothetical protein
VANLIGLAVGGYVAARFSGTADDTDGVLHGLSVWGIGYLLSAVLLGNIIAGTASTAVQGASSILAASRPAPAKRPRRRRAPRSRPAGHQPAAAHRAGPDGAADGGDPARMTSDQRNAEITSLVTRGRRAATCPSKTGSG